MTDHAPSLTVAARVPFDMEPYQPLPAIFARHGRSNQRSLSGGSVLTATAHEQRTKWFFRNACISSNQCWPLVKPPSLSIRGVFRMGEFRLGKHRGANDVIRSQLLNLRFGEPEKP